MKKFISVALIFMVSFHVSAQKKDTLPIDAGSLNVEQLKPGNSMYFVYNKSGNNPGIQNPTCVQINVGRENRDGKNCIISKQVWQTDTIIHTSLTQFEENSLRTAKHITWWKRKGYTERIDFGTKQVSFEGKINEEIKVKVTESVNAVLNDNFLNWHSDLIIFPLLPFQENRVFRINFYEPGSAKPNDELYEVLKSETITVAGIDIECWVLNYQVAKPEGYQRFWISKVSNELLKEEDRFGSFYRYKLKLIIAE